MPEPTPARALSRRAALRTLAVSAVAAPIVLGPLARTAAAAPPVAGAQAAATPLWHPNPATDGLKAFEGIEADRLGLHPDRKYAYVENNDHYRLNIWHDDLDSTGNRDRQRTEAKGMVSNGTALQMHNGQTWTINYEMYLPATLHGTSRFTHIFQTKTVSPDAGPWVTLDLTRAGDGTEMINARAYGTPGSPDIAAGKLSPLRDHWITIEWTLTIGQHGAASFVLLNGTGASAPVYAKGSETNVIIPDNGSSYVRPKWGIYRSIKSAPTDIIDTYILFRNYTATRTK